MMKHIYSANIVLRYLLPTHLRIFLRSFLSFFRATLSKAGSCCCDCDPPPSAPPTLAGALACGGGCGSRYAPFPASPAPSWWAIMVMMDTTRRLCGWVWGCSR